MHLPKIKNDDKVFVITNQEVIEVKEKINEIQGIRPTGDDDMYTIYECHTYLDLEGFEDTDIQGEQTGLKLPYIVSIDKNSGEVLSIIRNWDEEDPLRKAMQYFVLY